MFKKGDKYLHITKYGGVNKGEVEHQGAWMVVDRVNGVVYDDPFIKTTKGIYLKLGGSDGQIYKIREDITEEFEGRLEMISRMADLIRHRTKYTENGIDTSRKN